MLHRFSETAIFLLGPKERQFLTNLIPVLGSISGIQCDYLLFLYLELFMLKSNLLGQQQKNKY